MLLALTRANGQKRTVTSLIIQAPIGAVLWGQILKPYRTNNVMNS